MSMQLSQINNKIFMPLFYSLLGLTALGIADFLFLNYEASYYLLKNRIFHYYVPLIAFPHILSSLIIVFKNSHDQKVRKLSFQKILPIVGLGVLLFYTSRICFEIFFLILLTQHVQGQMYGLLSGLNPSYRGEMQIAKRLSYPSSFFAFATVYTPHVNAHIVANKTIIEPIIYLSLIVFFIYSLVVLMKLKTRKMFCFATLYSFGVFFFSYKINFLYWAIVFILGHDLMALIIYYLYYRNNDQSKAKALVQSLFLPLLVSISFVGISIYLKIPQMVFFFQIGHYFAERFCWKKGSVLREKISYEI